MKLLNGSELAGFIKERQAKQVRNLRQTHHVVPKLAIVRCDQGNSVIGTYVRIKKRYGEDVLIEVEEFHETIDSITERIRELNIDTQVHGIIVQLPIEPGEKTDEILQLVDPAKDVDGLGGQTHLDPATPMAINWLLVGYNIELKHKKIAIIGTGRLVGKPLARMWRNSGLDVTTFDESDANILGEALPRFDIIVTATGVPHLITATMLKPQAIVVDAGTASEGGVIVGDVADEVRERQDLTITPEKGGVGPLTVAALFDNVIRVARQQAEATTL